MRQPKADTADSKDADGNWRSSGDLYMNGAELFAFTMRDIPPCIVRLLGKTQTKIADYDLFIFHQANLYMLNHLRQSLEIPADKFYLALEHCGNTVSSTIPIALKHALVEGVLKAGMRVMLVGFGVGYSWGAVTLRWI
jgi:3-oxoacyl-[acyl-carrier-protein] synthase-3